MGGLAYMRRSNSVGRRRGGKRGCCYQPISPAVVKAALNPTSAFNGIKNKLFPRPAAEKHFIYLANDLIGQK